MLATYGAIYNRSTGELLDPASGSDRNGAVDNSDVGVEALNVTSGLPNKVSNLVRIADVKKVYLLNSFIKRCYIYSDRSMRVRQEFEERSADLSESHDNSTAFFSHGSISFS
jgi:hypothetical protein